MDGDSHANGRGQDLYEVAGDGPPADPGRYGVRLPVSHSRQGNRPAVRVSIHPLWAYVIWFWQATTVMDKGASARALPALARRLAIRPAGRPRRGPPAMAVIAIVALLVSLLAASTPALAATRTWGGLGADTKWMTAGNWDVLPVAKCSPCSFGSTLNPQLLAATGLFSECRCDGGSRR